MATDVVCGMMLDPASAAAVRDFRGRRYVFCGAECAGQFDADPARALRERPLLAGRLAALAPVGWLAVRLVVGIEWLQAGLEKLGEPGWTASPVGAAVDGFLRAAVERATTGPHPEVPHWYYNLIVDVFLPNTDVFAYLVTVGEIAVGVALIAGLFTRLAALGGVTMNLAFLWSGVSSTNPPLLLLGIAILFLGHNAGRYGLDGVVLPRLAAAAGDRPWWTLRAAGLLAACSAIAWLTFISADEVTWLATVFGVLAGAVLVELVAARVPALQPLRPTAALVRRARTAPPRP